MEKPTLSHTNIRLLFLKGARLAERCWISMALYMFFIWLAGTFILMPLTSTVLHQLAKNGDTIVGNYSMHEWVLTPQGLGYVLLGGAVLLMGLILNMAGLFWILQSHMNQPKSIQHTLLNVLAASPILFRLSLAMFILCLPVVLLLALGPGAAFLFFLSEHDINYYLTHRPAEWFWAIGFSGAWLIGVLLIVFRIAIRCIYVVPAWLEGYRPIHKALRQSWMKTADTGRPLVQVLIVGLLLWGASSLLIEGGLLQLAKWGLSRLESIEAVLRWATVYILLSWLLNAVLNFIFVGWGAGVWAVCYNLHDDEDSHAEAPALLSLLSRAAVRRILRLRFVLLITFALIGAGSMFWSWRVMRIDNDIPRPAIIAHRAGATHAPENTEAAVTWVLKNKHSDIIEVDVTITRDEKLVLAHDKDLMKQGDDPRVIGETLYDDLKDVDVGTYFGEEFEGETLQTLDQFLHRVKDEREVILEFKHGLGTPLIEQTIAAVREHKLQESVILMSLELEEIRLIQELAPEIRVGYFASVEAGDLATLDVDIMGLKDSLIEPSLIEELHSREVLIYVWTIDEPSRMLELALLGVDGLITNDPLKAGGLFDKAERLTPTARMLINFKPFWKLFAELGWWDDAPDLAEELEEE